MAHFTVLFLQFQLESCVAEFVDELLCHAHVDASVIQMCLKNIDPNKLMIGAQYMGNLWWSSLSNILVKSDHYRIRHLHPLVIRVITPVIYPFFSAIYKGPMTPILLQITWKPPPKPAACKQRRCCDWRSILLQRGCVDWQIFSLIGRMPFGGEENWVII